ncbi:MAG: tRNA 4-thiouridine(8) synthase ThiI [Clostridiales bacterium]|nr:tRNA 4-thiouridine(8) synthase ThiI [Clostridiales bacterium]
MKEIILIKNGELALKGLNRSSFEDKLVKNIRRRLKSIGDFDYKKSQSTIMIEPKNEDTDLDEVVEAISKIFGIACFSRAAAIKKDMQEIMPATVEYLKDELSLASTFKVNAKRSDKTFELKSPQICEELGGYILDHFPNLSVDVHNPEIIVTVEIRDNYAYIRGGQIKGAGGMPVGTGGRAAVLISGGIDSPVASYMMAKRGIELTAIHFASPPYTSERAELKVVQLLQQVSKYSGRMSMLVVPFTQIQEQIKDNCPEELFTLIMRRAMMRTANIIAQKQNCAALITGESVGQVASQTISALACTDAVAQMPVFRPLIGMDKDEIVAISRKIETFDISIQPYEDCCTVFTPKHPKLKPSIEELEKAEELIPLDSLIEKAIEEVKIIPIFANKE